MTYAVNAFGRGRREHAALFALLVAMTGCGAPEDEALCAARFHRKDGACVANPPPAGPDLGELPACKLLPEGTRIDLSTGCADGACSDMTYAQLNKALGEDGVCHVEEKLAYCVWDRGIETWFDDKDEDGVIDADAHASGIGVSWPFDGANEAGLGVGVSMQCFIDALGEADHATLEDGRLFALSWYYHGVYVADFDAITQADGFADALYLYGY